MNFYEHERVEKKTRYYGPRPKMPEEDESLHDLMHSYLVDRRLNPQLAFDNGWYPTKRGPHDIADRPRIVIPCRNTQGLCYFQARAMDSRNAMRYDSPAASREDSVVIVRPKKGEKGSVVVEGPMDALAAADLGYLGIAVMGNNPNDEVIAHVAKLVSEKTFVLPDNDHWEFGAWFVAGLAKHGKKAKTLLPTAKDLAAMPRVKRKELFQ